MAESLNAAKALTFRAAAEKYIAAHRIGWKNAKHSAQWGATLGTYVYPIFGELPVAAVDTTLVAKALEPIWGTKPETASRVRGRIESVLDWARARGYRSGENPARWRGHLDNLLPKRRNVRRVEHHAALPYAEIGDFMIELCNAESVSARALEFAILTAGRTGEVIGAQWAEVNLEEKLWTIPARRMKGGKEHRVPLSAPAVAIVRKLAESRTGEFVFPGGRHGKPLSNMALLMQLRRMGRCDLTGPGFRSTFRDWVADRTNFPSEVAEMALAHAVSDKVEAAYRVELLDRRKTLFGELVLGKPTDHPNPLRWRCDGNLPLQHAQGIRKGVHAIPAQFHVEVEAAANDVQMIVNETGQDTAALQIDNTRLLPGKTHDFCIAADGQEPAVFDCHRVRGRIAAVERREKASMQHQVGCRYLRIHESVPESCAPLDVPQ